MAQTLYYLASNLWSASTLTASSTLSGTNKEYSKNPERTLQWFSAASASTESLVADLGSSQAVTCVALANYNIRSGGTLKLYEGGTGGAPGAYTLVATLSAADSVSNVGHSIFGSVSARWWKLEWTTAGTDSAYVGYVFLGNYLTSTAPTWPTIEQHDRSVSVSSFDFQRSYYPRPHFASGSFKFPTLTETQLGDLHTVYATVGQHTPFFLILDTSTSWMAWLLRFAGPIQRSVVPAGARMYTVSFSWEEAV
jgi:hypothetical protein